MDGLISLHQYKLYIYFVCLVCMFVLMLSFFLSFFLLSFPFPFPAHAPILRLTLGIALPRSSSLALSHHHTIIPSRYHTITLVQFTLFLHTSLAPAHLTCRSRICGATRHLFFGYKNARSMSWQSKVLSTPNHLPFCFSHSTP